MLDIQALADDRQVPLEHVGVTRLALPISVKEKGGGHQHVSALANLLVEVPPAIKGTHMSRLVEELMVWADKPVASADIRALLEQTRERVQSFSCEVDLTFGYFMRRSAPVTQQVGVQRYDCEFRGRLEETGYSFVLGVKVPLTTLCPCSKAISDMGAHNQRSVVSVQVSYNIETFVWLEDLIHYVEQEGSCPVYPVLKRPDEKFVTEFAYSNPKFVEDVVRDVIISLKSKISGLTWISVECESQESIHSHNAYAAAQERVEVVDPHEAFPNGHERLSRSLR